MAERIVMPKLTATMQSGKVHKWHKQEGDYVQKGEILLEVAADKAVVQIEAPIAGYFLKCCCIEGNEIAVGKAVAYIGRQGEVIEEEIEQIDSLKKADLKSSGKERADRRTSKKATPVAKKMAKDLNIDLELVDGTGKDGLIGRQDIENYLLQQEPADPFILLEGTRKVMAERMSLSKKTAAHATTVAEVDMHNLAVAKQKEGFGYTSAVVSAAATALRDFPLINAALVENKIILHKDINISVAISTGEGLVVPVIRKADTKDVQATEAEIRRLAGRARDKGLTLSEMEGGTFTVTNSGVFGSLFFMPIINHPQSAIIGMGKVMDTPVARDGQVVIRPVMYLSLSYDHRIIEGVVGVKFLQKVKAILESWQ